MRLSRHAKNELRRLRGSKADVERVIDHPVRVDRDSFGKPRYTGYIKGIRVRIVVALDEPDFVVTLHKRRN
ncbi:MAG TPA: hypothetical protein VFW48_12175 [Solirubrobacterales bacterium]|nr:hypothetical protein [Solirubrobacterales bacterium]